MNNPNILDLIKWTKLIARNVDFPRHHAHCSRVVTFHNLYERRILKAAAKLEQEKIV